MAGYRMYSSWDSDAMARTATYSFSGNVVSLSGYCTLGNSLAGNYSRQVVDVDLLINGSYVNYYESILGRGAGGSCTHSVNVSIDPAVSVTGGRIRYTATDNEKTVTFNVYATYGITISTSASPSSAGTTGGGGTYAEGKSITLTATANTGYRFVNWTLNGTIVSTDSSYTFAVGSSDATYVANFEQLYQVTTSVNPTGSGTASGGGYYAEGDSVTLSATANTGYKFSNWTLNGTIVSTDNPYTFTMGSSDVSYVANFEELNHITTSVNPSDYGTASGDGYYDDGESVTLTATPNTHKLFSNWTLNGTIASTSNPYTFQASADASYVANFIDEEKLKISVSTNIENVGSVYISATRIWQGESVTLRARDESGYRFVQWSNGQTSNPITLTPTSNVSIVAFYEKVAEDTTTYNYRAYVKDQLALNTTPKAFMLVKSFKIRRDLLTTANSEIVVAEIPSNLNNGDILCLYEPSGKVIYYGVVSSFEDEKIKCSQIQSFYKGTWVYDTYSTTSLEAEIQYLLTRYSNGYMKSSTYQDLLVRQEKQPISVLTNSTTSKSLESQDDNYTMDMETFLYDMYEKYGLVFDFNIPYGAWTIGDTTKGSVTIRKPSSSAIKIGNNAESIVDLSPTTEVETTNRLIVYSSTGTYRKTYVATSTSGIVEEPSSVVGRFGQIETKIVFSDDDLATIRDANINSDLYNHKVEFTLLLDNNLYDFWSWELGQPMAIYNDDEYFNSVFTGYEISASENKKPTEVKIICGKVRTALTKMLTRGVINAK